jgi:hypothetical protein
MMSRKLLVVKCFGWAMFGVSLLLFTLGYHSVGPDWLPLIAVFLLVVGVLWWLKAVPAFRRQSSLEEAARQHEAAFRGNQPATGEERILRAGSLQLRCADPGAWYHYGYKRSVRWSVAESEEGEILGAIELRPTFLGRFTWPIKTEASRDFGHVKAGVEWSRLLAAPAGAVAAAAIPNFDHHATVSVQSRPVCAISWSGRSVALTFASGEWTPADRKLAIGAAVLLGCCPNYYRHA